MAKYCEDAKFRSSKIRMIFQVKSGKNAGAYRDDDDFVRQDAK